MTAPRTELLNVRRTHTHSITDDALEHDVDIAIDDWPGLLSVLENGFEVVNLH